MKRRALVCLVGVGTFVAVAACGTSRRDNIPPEKLGTSRDQLRLGNFNGQSLAAKQIALTFDDGPGTRTIELSAYLKAQGIRATFFVNGHCFDADKPCGNPGMSATQVFTQVVADGHLVGNHTQDHVDLTQFPAGAAGDANLLAQVTTTDSIIAPFVPVTKFLLRAPFGYWNQRDVDVIGGSAMSKYTGPINWDVGGGMTGDDATGFAADWDCWQNKDGFGKKTTAECATRYMNQFRSVGKGISLMHDSDSGSTPAGNTPDMVKLLVPLLKGEGFTFVRVDEIPAVVAALPPSPCDASCTSCSGPGANQCTGCADGKYLSGGVCSACNAACATCSGAGAATCTSCSGGKYLAGGSCTTCSTCSGAQYLSSACTATANTVCGACDASCETCTGAGAGACASCKGGTFLSGTTCTTCSACGASHYVASACTTMVDTVCGACDATCTVCSGPGAAECGACPTESYLAGGMCHACAVCAAGTSRTTACAANANTACSPCAAGTSSTATDATTCAPCAANTFAATAGATACTTCAPGTFAAAHATACSPCAAGTSAAAGAACTACAPGTYAAAGASSCTSCGDCNDGNACTDDTCDPAKGCTHKASASCPPSPAPVADAGADGATDPTPPEPGGDSGCSVTRAPGPSSSGLVWLALGAVGLVARTRRPGPWCVIRQRASGARAVRSAHAPLPGRQGGARHRSREPRRLGNAQRVPDDGPQAL